LITADVGMRTNCDTWALVKQDKTLSNSVRLSRVFFSRANAKIKQSASLSVLGCPITLNA
jgi:hypothetical protein